jgi:hypothetical protein
VELVLNAKNTPKSSALKWKEHDVGRAQTGDGVEMRERWGLLVIGTVAANNSEPPGIQASVRSVAIKQETA